MSEPKVSLSGPWTNEDRRRLMRRSYAVLGTFLERDDLPMVDWLVSEWSLTAQVTENDGDQGEIVRAWAKVLGLRLDTHAFDDHVRVTAVGKVYAKGGHTGVGITADIYSNSEGGDECPGL